MQGKTYNVKALVEAGFITAFIILIILINIYIPILSIFTNFIFPIPIAILYIRQNYKVTLISIAASGIFIAMFYNPISALSSIVLIGLTGITLGYCIKNKKEFATTIIFLAGSIAVGIIFYLFVYIMLINKAGIYGLVNKALLDLKQSMELSKGMYEKAGMSSSDIAAMENIFTIVTPEYIMGIIPAVVVIMSFVSSYVNYILAINILKRLRYEVKEIKPIAQWYMNTRIGTLVGIILVMGLLLDRKNMAVGQYLANSSGLILQWILCLDGVALITYYLMHRYKVSKKITALIIIFTAMSRLSLFYTIMGFIDMIIDFRRLDPYRKLKK
ncbi:YybS family protein [Clostridium sp. WILCCON 0269]|uniref:YybS family protein n=1 Tax=Candidatus Clostridium eludens TaxID=3381663 RepID=A0ABW8SRX9_9CLOT